jgi:hypothetical protein
MNATNTKTRWTVEWVRSCPLDGHGGCISDQADVVKEHFATRKQAEKRLREIDRKVLDFFDDPRMCQEEYRLWHVDEETGRPFREWQEVGDSWRIDNGVLFVSR